MPSIEASLRVWSRLWIFLKVLLLLIGAWLILCIVLFITRASRLNDRLKVLTTDYQTLRDSYSKMGIEYSKMVTTFNEAVSNSTISYVKIGPDRLGRPLTMVIRPYDNATETEILPVLIRPPTVSETSVCFQLDTVGVCDSVARINQTNCYPCEPTLMVLDRDGSVTTEDTINKGVAKEVTIYGSIYQSRLYLSKVSVRTPDSQISLLYTIDNQLSDAVRKGLVVDFASPAVMVAELLPDTVYSITTNAAGLFTLIPVNTDGKLPPLVPGVRTTYQPQPMPILPEPPTSPGASFLDSGFFLNFN